MIKEIETVSVRFDSDNSIDWVCSVVNSDPVLKIEFHYDYRPSKIIFILNKKHILKFIYSNSEARLFEYSYTKMGSPFNTIYDIIRNDMPAFPVISKEDKTLFKLKHNSDISFLEMDDTGRLTDKCLEDIKLMTQDMLVEFVRQSPEGRNSQVYKWLKGKDMAHLLNSDS